MYNQVNVDFEKIEFTDFGVVISVTDGVVTVIGLDDVKSGELIYIGSNKVPGLVLNLETKIIKAILLDSDRLVSEGDVVTKSDSLVSIGINSSLLGRVVDPLGNPIDGLAPLSFSSVFPIDVKAPGIVSRKSVYQSMPTGIKIIDSMFPIGNGQRELIIGDRQTGKTSIAIDTIINQQNNELEMICVYVAIGQKKSSIAFIVNKLKDYNCLNYTTFMLAGASDPAALQFLAPYSGCTIGEWFRDNGMNALVVYDDLSKHAVAYRQVSLLLRRPPSRDAYPGDIFYLHSRLLERAAKLSENYGGGSLTALPIIETLSGDLSAYIPTNVISITDGQIFLEEELFKGGIRPAINLNLSVSRVGSAAQNKLMKSISGNLKFYLARYNEDKIFSSFSGDLDSTTLLILNRGSKLVELLKQKNYSPITIAEQFVLLFSGLNGLFDDIPFSEMARAEKIILNEFKNIEFYNEDESLENIQKELSESIKSILEERI